jgi:hypothetical protein
MKKYYVLELWRDVEPILHGPFATDTERAEWHEQLRKADPSCRNGLYVLSSTGAIRIE